MTDRPTRRAFLKQAGAVGAFGPLLLTRGAAGHNVSRKLRHASIGVGGMGAADLNKLSSHADCEIVALCDVDARHLAKAGKKFPKARQYRDWRELLEKEGSRLDSVNVTTPDHMHAPITMTALRMGLHVYSQKPLCHDIHEAQQVTAEAAARPEQVTQMGIQVHSYPAYRKAVKMIQYGIIGKIKEVHSWSDKQWTGKKGSLEHRPDKSDAVPSHLDWDLWLGTAPERPYVEGLYHPGDWRRWIDFGTGTQGDMAAHIMDPVFGACAFTHPKWVMSYHTPPYAGTYSPDNKIRHHFPATPYTAGEIDWYWYDAGAKPDTSDWPIGGPNQRSRPSQGSMFIGEKGHLLLPHIGGPQPLPLEEFIPQLKRFEKDVDIPDIPNHYHQFVNAALGKGETTAPFSYAGPLTQTVLMGTVINRFPKQKLMWDAEACRFTNKPEANQHLRRTYREGWSVDGLG
jgi:predicted dehydrogenase